MVHPWKSLPLSRVVVRTLERCGFLALGIGKRKFRRGTAGMSCWACCLVRVGVGRGDGCHETDPSLNAIHQISQGSRCLDGADDGHKRTRQ